MLPKPEDSMKQPKAEDFKLKTHLIIYGIDDTIIACVGQILTLLEKKKIKYNVVGQREVTYDLAKFPATFKRCKIPECFQGKRDDSTFDQSLKSSGKEDCIYEADLNYRSHQEISTGALVLFKKAAQSINFSEVGKGVINVISNKITGYSNF